MDPGRHVESVLSKLMGLDKLPTQPPALGRQRVLSQSYFENIASIAHREKWAFEGSTMDVDGRIETKVAFEEQQRQGNSKHHHQPAMKEKANMSIKEAEREGLTKKLKDARSLTKDQNFHHRKKISYSLNSPQDKHLCNLPDIVPCSHLTLSKSTSASTDNEKLGKVKSFQGLDTPCFTKSHVELGNIYVTKLLKSRSGRKKVPYIPSSRLVPESDSGNAHHAGRSSLSPCSLLGNRSHRFSSSVRSNALYFETRGRRNMHRSMEPFNHSSKLPGDVAKQITSEIKDSVWHHYSTISESKHEKVSPCRFDLKNWNKATSRVQASCQTLDVPIPQLKCQILDDRLPEDSHIPGRDNTNMDLFPLSTSNINNSREFPIPVIGRSTSTLRGGRRRFIVHRDWCLYPKENDNLECVKTWEDNCAPKGFLGPRDLSSIVMDLNKPKEEILSEEISIVQSLGYTSAGSDIEVVTNCETHKISDELQDRLQDTDFSLKDSIASRPLACDFVYLTLDGVEVNNAKQDIILSSKHKSEQQSQPILFEKDAESNPDCLNAPMQQFRDDSTLVPSHFTETEKETIEAYVGSPDSVLESIEIPPDAEGDERTGNNLHGLKMKLKLYKAESLELDFEGPGLIVSSDEDTEKVSFDSYRENAEKKRICNISESLDFSYLVDVLVELGFNGGNLKDCKIQKSLEFAINPLVFDVLEKKYGKQTNWKRSERRLLFDRINLGLAEILCPYKGMAIESRSMAKTFMCLQHPELITDVLWTWLVNEEKEARSESSAKVLGRDLEWLELGGDISETVREIERLLIDELVEEVYT